MFERFTDRARRVVVLAQEEARMLNHNYIGTEHILLGLIHEGEGVAAKALESLNILCLIQICEPTRHSLISSCVFWL
jgi:ATP-dependent Clp protease ATP-binding subunit ClpC